MPFIQDGGGAGGAIGSGLGIATLHVELGQVVALKTELEAIRDEAQEVVAAKQDQLRIAPLGADPVSGDTAEVFNQNAQTAMDAAYFRWNPATVCKKLKRYGIPASGATC